MMSKAYAKQIQLHYFVNSLPIMVPACRFFRRRHVREG